MIFCILFRTEYQLIIWWFIYRNKQDACPFPSPSPSPPPVLRIVNKDPTRSPFLSSGVCSPTWTWSEMLCFFSYVAYDYIGSAYVVASTYGHGAPLVGVEYGQAILLCPLQISWRGFHIWGWSMRSCSSTHAIEVGEWRGSHGDRRGETLLSQAQVFPCMFVLLIC
jgi:hypothetical protein